MQIIALTVVQKWTEMKRMTDEKIIEAAHRCIGDHFVCTNCPLYEEPCNTIFATYILNNLDKSADNARSNALVCERSVNDET